jgi:hypothetical protein
VPSAAPCPHKEWVQVGIEPDGKTPRFQEVCK